MSNRIKLCGVCGGVMRKSSRRVLSVPAGIFLIILGALLMAGYGFFTNFYQAPWFMRFALPSLYYVGSILIGVGFIFFFIRENVWRCVDCKEMTKR